MDDFSAIPGVGADDSLQNKSVDPKLAAQEAAQAQPAPEAPANNMPTATEQSMMFGDPRAYYMGDKLKPENVLQDPNAAPEQKIQALSLIKSQEQEKMQQQAETEVQKAAAAKNQLDAFNQKQSEIEAYNAEAPKRGLKPLPAADPKQFGLDASTIAKLSQPGVQEQLEPVVQQQKQQQADFEQKKQDVLEQAHAQRQVANQMNGQQKAMLDAKNQMDEAVATANQQQDTLSNIDNNRFYKNRSTGDKIIGAIAAGLSALGGNSGKNNTALELIQKAVDNDIASQKVDQEKALALRANALKRAGLEIEKFKALSEDNSRKQQLEIMRQQVDQARQQALQQQAVQMKVGKALTSGDGLSPEEAAMTVTDEKMRNNLVAMPNGRYKMATNADAAKKLTEWNSATVGAMQLANTLRDQVAQLSYGDRVMDKVGLSQQAKLVDQTTKGLIGQLRIPFTGPGVLTNNEFDRLASSVVGDTTSLFSRKNIVMAQLDGLQDLLHGMQAAQYRAAGVNIPQSPQEKKLESYIISNLKAGVDPITIKKSAMKLGLYQK